MAIKIDVGIVTTAGREEYLNKTVESLLKGYPEGTTVPLFKDLAEGLTPNHIASWKALIAMDGDYALLLQDDIQASKNWYEAAQLLGEQSPIVSLYSGLGITGEQKNLDKGYVNIPASKWINEQAMLIRKDVLAMYLGWVAAKGYKSTLPESDWKHHDCILRQFFKDFGITVTLSAPSIFQHVGVDSTMGHPFVIGKNKRQSKSFEGEDFDAYEYFKEKLC